MTTSPPVPSGTARRLALLGVLAAGSLLLAACGSSGSGSSGAAATVSATPGAVGVASTGLGTVLTDGSGRTLYMLTADKTGSSSCSGACVAAWPVVAPITGQAPGVTATISSLTRSDGSKQLTVDGLPAYTYAGDGSPGAITGQGVASFGGTWWVMGVDGKPITAAPTTMSGGRY